MGKMLTSGNGGNWREKEKEPDRNTESKLEREQG